MKEENKCAKYMTVEINNKKSVSNWLWQDPWMVIIVLKINLKKPKTHSNARAPTHTHTHTHARTHTRTHTRTDTNKHKNQISRRHHFDTGWLGTPNYLHTDFLYSQAQGVEL